MFDDQNVQGGNIPNNLPIGEPEDMFADVDPAADPAPAQSQQSAPTEQPAAPAADNTPIQEEKRAGDASAAPIAEGSLPTAMGAGKLQPKSEMSAPADGASPQAAPAAEIPLAPPPPVGTAAQDASAPLPSAPQTDPSMSTMPPEAMGQEDMHGSNIGRTIMLIGIILVAAAIIGGGIWYTVTLFLADSTDPTAEPDAAPSVVEVPIAEPEIEDEMPTMPPPAEEATTTTISADDAPAGIPLPGSNNDISDEDTAAASGDVTDNQILFGDDVDTDEDGLSDDRELEFGTDPRNWDTDGDELGDGVEVLNWGTDPLNPDTDGDGYLDGAEVNAGYSPVAGGGARLFETTTSTEASTTTAS